MGLESQVVAASASSAVEHPTLGRRVASFVLAEETASVQWVLIPMVAGLGAPGVILAVIGLNLLFSGNWQGALILFAGSALFIGFARSTWKDSRAVRGNRTDVYENGVESLVTGKKTVLPWAEVETILDSRKFIIPVVGKGTHTRSLTIRRKLGDEVIFSNDQADVVGEQVMKACVPRLLEAAHHAATQGRPVRFGALSLEKSGLVVGSPGKPAVLRERWDKIDQFRYNNGNLELVRKDGTKADLGALGLLPNLVVFEQVLTEDFKMLLDRYGGE